jgi:methenyltetrahydromethanopterin cyclohydrolase
MTTRTHIAALFISLAATGTAFAQETTQELPQPIVSSGSRAAVVAERDQARITSAARVTETDWPAISFVAQKTRDQVRAETRVAIASGELRALNHEPYSAYVVTAPAAPAQTVVLTAALK